MRYILTYGIACIEEQGGRSEVIARVSDVTGSREEAEKLVKLCNSLCLSPLHLPDVIDDLLARV